MLAISGEVFCRRSFGPRYVLHLIAGWAACFLFAGVVQAWTPGRDTSLLSLYVLAYFALVCRHIYSVIRGRSGATHSESNGEPWRCWRRLPVSANTVKLLLEPALLMLAGLMVAPIETTLAVWLAGSGICHFIKGAIISMQFRRRVLDALDARIDGEQTSEAVREYRNSSPTQARAPVAEVVNQARQPRNTTMRDIVGNLDPALRRLMSGGEQKPGPQAAPLRRPGRPVIHVHHAGPLGSLPRITARPKPR